MAKYKYGMQKPVQNALQQCINSFERMKRGGVGIADELVYDTCKRALKYIDELEAKLAESEPVRHGEWANEETNVTCTACGRSYDTDFEIKRSVTLGFKYCPSCGAKMDGDSNAELLETAAKPIDKNIAQSGLAPATENFELMEG